jgi:hypothetical protein
MDESGDISTSGRREALNTDSSANLISMDQHGEIGSIFDFFFQNTGDTGTRVFFSVQCTYSCCISTCTAVNFPSLFNRDPAARGTMKTPGFISLLKMTTADIQFASPERHHPMGTLETVQFGVSNVHGCLLGPEIAQVEGRPSWPSGVPAEAASGRAAHHARSSRLIARSCMHRQLRLQNRTMTCHAWWTSRLCAYIYKYQSDSIYVRTSVYTADLSMCSIE